MWTRFMDMHSGGGQKEDWQYIYIEAPQNIAEVIFYNKFGHNPNRVTCNCCGSDYSISSNESLEQLTGDDRECDYVYFDPNGKECSDEKEYWEYGKGFKKGYTCGYVNRNKSKYYWKDFQTLEEYKKNPEVLFIYSENILLSERNGFLPEEYNYDWDND